MVAAALIGSAVVGAGASIYGSSKAAGASKSANKQQQANLAPYMSLGSQATNALANPMKNFYTSPNYNFTMQQGLNAVGTDKAVNGLLRSGSAIKSLNNFAQGTAAGQYNTWYQQQEQNATIGANAVSGSNTAIATNATNQGNAAITQGNTIGGLAGSLAAIYQNYSGSGSSYGGGGGSGGGGGGGG